MKRSVIGIAMAAAVLLSGCGGGGGVPPKGDGTFSAADYAALPEIRFASLCCADCGAGDKFKLRAPEAGVYSVSFSSNLVERVELFTPEGERLADETGNFSVTLSKDQLVYANVVSKNGLIRLNVAPENGAPLPFELGEIPSPETFSVGTMSEDPLRPAPISYQKRKDTLYVYCNAPEMVSFKREVVNHCITRKTVEDQEVFFTFEHQSDNLSPSVYYGYRVRNVGDEDLFVTVKNVGFQRSGMGTYHGEQEWIQFYNTKFELPSFADLTPSQMANYEAYFNFSGSYPLNGFQPTTYRVPKGKFIYVLGGTKSDSYGGFTVGGTGDKAANGSCQNGAVLFEVAGKAEAGFYIYDDPARIALGTEGGDSHLGISDASYGEVHTGYDEGFVVDNSAVWEFNDETESQKLPVTFTNYYADDAPSTGEPGAAIPATPHENTADEWVTHINVQAEHEAVGTDMTSFHTLGPDGSPLTVGCGWYDSRGRLANLGNWMKDYQDVFTFVNHGDTEREVTVRLNFTGAIATMVRSADGKIVPGTAKYVFQFGKTDYGDAFDKSFAYTVKVPAHSVKQFVVEYNLMANSYGYVRHSVDLA